MHSGFTRAAPRKPGKVHTRVSGSIVAGSYERNIGCDGREVERPNQGRLDMLCQSLLGVEPRRTSDMLRKILLVFILLPRLCLLCRTGLDRVRDNSLGLRSSIHE